MKKKITFPDWTSPAAVTITRGGTKDKPRAVWSEYTQDPAEWLSLRVTLEIAGGSVLFETFDSREEEEAARLEANRRAAWRNALVFAEQLWRAAPHHEFPNITPHTERNLNRAGADTHNLKAINTT